MKKNWNMFFFPIQLKDNVHLIQTNICIVMPYYFESSCICCDSLELSSQFWIWAFAIALACSGSASISAVTLNANALSPSTVFISRCCSDKLLVTIAVRSASLWVPESHIRYPILRRLILFLTTLGFLLSDYSFGNQNKYSIRWQPINIK